MELKALKQKLGRWFSIEELKTFLAELPDGVCQKIPINQKLLRIASEFVEEQGGRWEHADWESFLARLSKERFSISDEARAPIGNVLEIFKKYYHSNNFETIVEKRQKPATPSSVANKRPSPANGPRARKISDP
jgi:hypothetical protein